MTAPEPDATLDAFDVMVKAARAGLAVQASKSKPEEEDDTLSEVPQRDA